MTPQNDGTFVLAAVSETGCSRRAAHFDACVSGAQRTHSWRHPNGVDNAIRLLGRTIPASSQASSSTVSVTDEIESIPACIKVIDWISILMDGSATALWRSH